MNTAACGDTIYTKSEAYADYIMGEGLSEGLMDCYCFQEAKS